VIVQHEERVTPWRPFGHHGFSHVRIWQRLTAFGMFQRHEWKRDDGSRSVDRWITGGRHWCEGAAKSVETLPSETDIAIAALKRIADGHNDSRTLAAETLHLIESAA